MTDVKNIVLETTQILSDAFRTRIEELLEANNCYLEEAREARRQLRALRAILDYGATEMRLCEADHVQLQPNRLYLFTVDHDCPACVKAAERANFAS